MPKPNMDLARELVRKGVPPYVALRRASISKPVLGSLGYKILDHWTTHRPKMTAELRRLGRLETAVCAAEQWTLDAQSAAIRRGLTPDQALELTREEWAFLPDEEDVPTLGSNPAEWAALPDPTSGAPTTS